MFSRLSENRLFAPNCKLVLQIVYLLLVLAAIAITAARIPKLGGQMSRADTMAIVMGAKSIVIFAYILVTTHVQSCRRWGSLMAYKILDALEIIFWLAVVVLGVMGIQRRCTGVACTLAIVVIVIAILLMCLAAWLAIIATLDHSHYKAHGTKRGERMAYSDNAMQQAPSHKNGSARMV